MSDFVYTTAIRRLRKLTKRIRCVPGGSSAGKTFGILPILIDKAARTPKLEISVVSESIPHLRRGAMKDFLKIMQATGRYNDAHWNRTLLKYNFANGSYIEFFSADQPDNVRGPRRNILYINEANNVPFDTYHQLAIRTSDEIWLDWNPANEFWAYTELFHDPDADWLTLTYKDNEALSDSIVKEIEKAKIKAETSEYWANWWRVYGLGELGMLEGVIFSNWKITGKLPPDARLIGRGLDFGYSHDPCAIVDVYTWNGKRLIDLKTYQTGLLNKAIADLLNNDVPIYCDSAEPKSIDELKNYGIYQATGVRKGADSINYGIQIMQGQEYLITERSVELIKELRSYCWDKDKRTGQQLAKPCGVDHAIDALRYHEMETIGVAQSWPTLWA